MCASLFIHREGIKLPAVLGLHHGIGGGGDEGELAVGGAEDHVQALVATVVQGDVFQLEADALHLLEGVDHALGFFVGLGADEGIPLAAYLPCGKSTALFNQASPAPGMDGGHGAADFFQDGSELVVYDLMIFVSSSFSAV